MYTHARSLCTQIVWVCVCVRMCVRALVICNMYRYCLLYTSVFYKSMTSSSGCCLLLLSSVFFSSVFWDWYLLHLLLDAIRFLGIFSIFFFILEIHHLYCSILAYSWFPFYLFFLVVGSVSYTHLDVYKRQLVYGTKARIQVILTRRVLWEMSLRNSQASCLISLQIYYALNTEHVRTLVCCTRIFMCL